MKDAPRLRQARAPSAGIERASSLRRVALGGAVVEDSKGAESAIETDADGEDGDYTSETDVDGDEEHLVQTPKCAGKGEGE